MQAVEQLSRWPRLRRLGLTRFAIYYAERDYEPFLPLIATKGLSHFSMGILLECCSPHSMQRHLCNESLTSLQHLQLSTASPLEPFFLWSGLHKVSVFVRLTHRDVR